MSSSSQSILELEQASHLAPVSTSTPELEEALFVAARNGDNAEIDRLRKLGVNLYARNRDRYTALHIAILNGQTETIVHLVEKHGMDVYAKIDHDDNTVLHLAAWGGQIQVINLFVYRYGMDVHAKNKYGNTLLHLTVRDRRIDEIASRDREIGEIVKTLQIKTIKHLVLTHKIYIDAKATSDGYTALHMAALNSPIEIIACLVELGANLYTPNDSSGFTILHVAAWGDGMKS